MFSTEVPKIRIIFLGKEIFLRSS